MCKENNDNQNNEHINEEVQKKEPTPIKLKTTFTLDEKSDNGQGDKQ